MIRLEKNDGGAQVVTRLFSCQSSIQLISSLCAANAVRAVDDEVDTENHLVFSNLSIPPARAKQYFEMIKEMAGKLGPWNSLIHMDRAKSDELQRIVTSATTTELRRWLRQNLGIDAVNEVYLSKPYGAINNSLAAAYKSARKICYGDGIGINFSQTYFAGDVPTPPKSVITSLRQRLAQFKRAALKMLRNMDDIPVATSFDEHVLLLPNLFDVQAPQCVTPSKENYLRYFSLIKPPSMQPDGRVLNLIKEALIQNRDLWVVLTVNFSEYEKMTLNSELAAYSEFINTELNNTTHSHSISDPFVLIKPHPLDSPEKLEKLKLMLSERLSSVVVLDDPAESFLPVESLLPDLIKELPPSRVKIFTFSTSCLSLEHLYDHRCLLGFGEELVTRYFLPLEIKTRLRHEADLRNAVANIRTSNA